MKRKQSLAMFEGEETYYLGSLLDNSSRISYDPHYMQDGDVFKIYNGHSILTMVVADDWKVHGNVCTMLVTLLNEKTYHNKSSRQPGRTVKDLISDLDYLKREFEL